MVPKGFVVWIPGYIGRAYAGAGHWDGELFDGARHAALSRMGSESVYRLAGDETFLCAGPFSLG